jgi:hypothetical protein
MIRAAFIIPAVLILAACQKQPAAPGQAGEPGAATPAAAVSTSTSTTPSPPPDLSGEPVQGSVAMAEGAATTDPNAPRPAPK